MTRFFRIFFFRSIRGGSLVDRLLAKAIFDYNRSFAYSDLAHISHVGVQFDDLYVETLIDGTLIGLHQFTEETDFFEVMPRLEAYWEYPLDDLSEEAIAAHKFVLKSFEGKSLDILGCLKYLGELGVAEKFGFEEQEAVLGAPKAHIRNNTLLYTLPYTCCTPANSLLWKVAEVDISTDSHIAPNLFITCWVAAGFGCGDFISNIPIEAIIG